jgi:hypothetical protein
MAANPATQPQPEEIQSGQVVDTATIGNNATGETTQTETALEKAIRILFQPGDLVEVRGKLLTGKCRSKFYSDHQLLAAVIEKANASEKYEAIWCTLQKLKPSALNSKQRNESTGREDIQCYEWLVIDVDRPAGDPNKSLNATDEELARLKQVARDIVGAKAGDFVTITLEPDTEKRQIEVPIPLQKRLGTKLTQKQNNLSFTHKKEFIVWHSEAKKEETRARRIEKMKQMLSAGKVIS